MLPTPLGSFGEISRVALRNSPGSYRVQGCPSRRTHKVMPTRADNMDDFRPEHQRQGDYGLTFGATPRLSFKRRLLIWRARLSVPSLLAGRDERKVISLVTAVNGGFAILILGALAWIIDLPLLFPALGPSAFILFSSPFSRAAAPRSVVLGHFAAMLSGWVVWHLVSLICGQPLTLELAGWPVFISGALALAVSCVLLVRLSCPHAPACATALIIALGAASDWAALLGMAAGVLLLTTQAVLISRIAGINVPTWSPGCEQSRQNRRQGPWPEPARPGKRAID